MWQQEGAHEIGNVVVDMVAVRPAGDHSLTWHGNDDTGRPVSSGVYLYSLRSGEEEVTRTMTLVR